jgi:hypothetical protein
MTVEAVDKEPIWSRLELKDWLLLVPAMGSCVAVTYEIGCFVPLGSSTFGLFSLSEHLLWALQALPFAMIFVAGAFTALIFQASFESRLEKSAADETAETKARKKVLGVIFVLTLLLIAILLRQAAYVWIPFVMLIFALLPKPGRPRPVLGICFITFTALTFVLLTGFDQTRSLLNKSDPARFDFGGANVKQLILVRSGEHGLLLYDRPAGRFLFTKMDDLKTIVWDRNSAAPSILRW